MSKKRIGNKHYLVGTDHGEQKRHIDQLLSRKISKTEKKMSADPRPEKSLRRISQKDGGLETATTRSGNKKKFAK